MKYKSIYKAEFISRPNRFIAKVLLDGVEETVHVKNTGRCRELLIPGCTVYLEKSDNPERKTLYDLVATRKPTGDGGTVLVNMDSQTVNSVAAEWLPKSGLFSKDAVIKREVTHHSSRFDFYIEDGDGKSFLEVKGVTLERDGTALFPDAPTERGTKHLLELCRCIDEGYGAYVLFVIQMKGTKELIPNRETDPAFAKALETCRDKGVKIIAVDCSVTPDSITIDKEIPVVI